MPAASPVIVGLTLIVAPALPLAGLMFHFESETLAVQENVPDPPFVTCTDCDAGAAPPCWALKVSEAGFN